MSFDREMYVSAIVGKLPVSRQTCDDMVAKGLMSYKGGFQDDYTWKREEVKLLKDGELEALYLRLQREGL